jgi:hypothetical protein
MKWQVQPFLRKGNFRQNIESMSPFEKNSPEKKKLINLFPNPH